MGKVFNDQIVQILCAKNLHTAPNELVESGPNSKCSSMKRGESYVVFMDKHRRRDLQRQIIGLEQRFKASADTSLCAVRKCNAALPGDGALEPWTDPRLRQHVIGHAKSMEARLRVSLSSVVDLVKRPFRKKTSNAVARRYQDSAGKEKKPPAPAVFGPFPDESLCAFCDRLYFCVCLLLGRQLEPMEGEQ